jgi:hypothetical protein
MYKLFPTYNPPVGTTNAPIPPLAAAVLLLKEPIPPTVKSPLNVKLLVPRLTDPPPFKVNGPLTKCCCICKCSRSSYI